MASDRLHRAVFFAVFAAIAFALCMLARPAFAFEAPFCDDRGATALAPPPALDASNEAITRARACVSGGDDTSYLVRVTRARGGTVWSAPAADAAFLVQTPQLGGPPLERLRSPSWARACDSGIRSRVDRPPRT